MFLNISCLYNTYFNYLCVRFQEDESVINVSGSQSTSTQSRQNSFQLKTLGLKMMLYTFTQVSKLTKKFVLYSQNLDPQLTV